jgi:hypothetical protein
LAANVLYPSEFIGHPLPVRLIARLVNGAPYIGQIDTEECIQQQFGVSFDCDLKRGGFGQTDVSASVVVQTEGLFPEIARFDIFGFEYIDGRIAQKNLVVVSLTD